jgi:osmotically-inducible protein OsmY
MSADEIYGSGGSAMELWLSGGEEHVEEVALQRSVWEEIAADERLRDLDVRVEVIGGVAVLEGTVARSLLKTAVEGAARRVAGLRGVENRIEVHGGFTTASSRLE